MRNYLKAAALGAVTALTLGASIGTAVAGVSTVKPHATTVCDNVTTNPCTNISVLMENQGNDPDLIQNATNGQAAIGRRINLRQASDTRTNEDFIIRKVGTVGQLCETTGVNALDPTSYACLVYDRNGGSNYPVFQGQFAPDSNESGMCVGALAAQAGFKLRLVHCGSPRSFWVGDLAASVTFTVPSPISFLIYFPLEFAADTSASNPLVMTFNPDSTNPVNKLTLQQENFSGGSVPDRQMFTLTRPVGFSPRR